MKIRKFVSLSAIAAGALLAGASSHCLAQSKPAVIEEIVARVNNSIITFSEYQKEYGQIQQEVQQDCQNCTQGQIAGEVQDHRKNLLRDMIDQQLLIERAKDMDINVETDLVKHLDDVRKQNNLATMEDLEKAVEASGVVWEDYKGKMRDSMLTQEVIRREVGGRLDIGSDEVKKYYDAHKQDYNRPEQVDLAEIFLSTENSSPEEVAAIHTRAEDLHNRLLKGEDFTALAKRYSQGSTAQDGGELGTYERGQLAKQLEDAVFPLDRNGYTDVIQTKNGFEILKVNDHFQAGLQPLDKVNGEIQNILYRQKMEPALRTYLAQLREESYVQVKPGYTDTAAVAGATVIQEVAPTPDAPDKKKSKKKPGLPKVNS